MASQLRSAGLGQTIARVGGIVHWSNPTNIYTSNNVYATVELERPDYEYSHWLRATNFGFSIPDGAIIAGIKVEIEKKSDEPTDVHDESVKIVDDGYETGDEKKLLGDWTTTDTYYVYGGASDLWGESWTPAQINASNFGVQLAAHFDVYDEYTDAYVDHIRITVYYTEPSTNMKINIGDNFKDVEEIKINIGDVWKPVVKMQINIGDVWKTIFGA